MNYMDYTEPQNAALRVLLDSGIRELPVDLNSVCRRYGMHAYPYSSTSGLDASIQRKTDGLAYYSGHTPIILYNGMKSAERIRFAVAHEIGHFVLGHLTPQFKSRYFGRNSREQAANMFAAHLLVPSCILLEIGVCAPREIADLCHVSVQTAKLQVEHLEDLHRGRDDAMPLLKQMMHEQFEPFVTEFLSRHQ